MGLSVCFRVLALSELACSNDNNRLKRAVNWCYNPEKDVNLTMARLHVREWGQGDTVVLVHDSSSPDAAHTWEKQRELAEQFHLIVPDRRGYGQSPPSEGVDDEVEDLIELLGNGALGDPCST